MGNNTLSHSQMETFGQCRLRWRLEKIDRAPRAPASALILGDAFHAAIEADGKAHLNGKPRLTPRELREVGSYAMGRRIAEDDPHGLISVEETADMVRRLDAMLAAYAETIQAAYRPIAVERELTAALPGGAGADGWRFTGRLDALTEHGIVDFKTAGKPWPVGAEHHKPQASAYHWLCDRADSEEGWGWSPPQCAFLVFATTRNEDGTYTATVERRVTTRTRPQVAFWAATAERTAAEIDEARASGDFPANPSPLCGWCAVLGSCEVGQAWLAERGRVPAVPVVARSAPREVKR